MWGGEVRCVCVCVCVLGGSTPSAVVSPSRMSSGVRPGSPDGATTEPSPCRATYIETMVGVTLLEPSYPFLFQVRRNHTVTGGGTVQRDKHM